MTRAIQADPELAGSAIHLDYFEYRTPKFRRRPDQRIADVRDIGGSLGTYLKAKFTETDQIVLVTHSQGGLVVQQFLAETCLRERAHELARIRQIVMYACPTTGSEFFLSLRKSVWFWRNPQERWLRPFHEAVLSAHRTVLDQVVFARGRSATECQIPIAAYGGLEDGVVPPDVATWGFIDTGRVPGDHSSIIRPTGTDSTSYLVLKQALTSVATVARIEQQPENARDSGLSVSVEPPAADLQRPLRGRDQLLAAVDHHPDARVQVLTGEGGVGKTRLALEIAYRARRRGQLVLWIRMSRLNGCMREVATRLGATANQLDYASRGPSGPADLVWRLLNEQRKPWLLVFDNADDPRLLAAPGERVSEGAGWLRKPEGDYGRVLVTSRQGNETKWAPWSLVHQVPPLEVYAGAAVLRDIFPTGGTVIEARELSAQLGGLPLRLRKAAEYLESANKARGFHGPDEARTFDGYRLAVQRRWKSPGEATSELDDVLGVSLTRQVITLSLSLVTGRGVPDAATLLKLLSCFSIAPIPYYLLFRATPPGTSHLFDEMSTGQAIHALEELANVGLVELHTLPISGPADIQHVLSLHPEIHHVLNEDDDVRERHDEYYTLAVHMILAIAAAHDPDDPTTWPIWNRLVAHSTHVARAALVGPAPLREHATVTAAVDVARLSLRYLVARGFLDPADELAGAIIDGCADCLLDVNDPEILAIRHERARIVLERGDRVTAERMFREILARRTVILPGGDRNPDTLASRHKLARAILEQEGRAAEAEAELRTIVELERDVRGFDHSDTLVVRRSLARALIYQGRADQALPQLREILAVSLAQWPPTRPETLWVRHTSTRCLLELEDYATAEREARDALNLVASAENSTDSPVVRWSMTMRRSLAMALLGQGRVDEAAEIVDTLRRQAGEQLDPSDALHERIMTLWENMRQPLPGQHSDSGEPRGECDEADVR
ncbi:tetratricopeptide repeat protein [Nocardia inohanensis]|uniref:tetratricopeptide repeat protein n=1 Tax=Nocardia inohanensis TaxID=209246 RepID=UPI00147212E9|nr:tetratricopeptide repeat protein [Nocardia inohanensis]